MADPTFCDLDNDGDFDLFIGEAGGNAIYFENIGNAGNPNFGSSTVNPFGISDVGIDASPEFIDIDGDNDFDLFMGSKTGNERYFENTGNQSSPSFIAFVANPFELTGVGKWSRPDFSDIDNDGDADLLVGEKQGEIVYFENLTEALPSGTCDQPSSVTIAEGITEATLHWDLEPDASATQIQYRIHPSDGGGGNNTIIGAGGAVSELLPGLQPSTSYQLRFRHFCDTLGFSPWKFKPFMTFDIIPAGEQLPFARMYYGMDEKRLFIEMTSDNQSITQATIEIFDLLGKKVFEQKAEVSGRSVEQIEMGRFHAGHYIVRTTLGERAFSKAVVAAN
jgi:hypothetical protein